MRVEELTLAAYSLRGGSFIIALGVRWYGERSSAENAMNEGCDCGRPGGQGAQSAESGP